MQVRDETVVLDRQQLRDITLDDRELMEEVLCSLLDDTSHQLRLMDTAIRAHDPKQAIRLAHSCKGACANVGANAVAAALRKLEIQAADGAYEQCAGTLEDITRELGRLELEVAKARREI